MATSNSFDWVKARSQCSVGMLFEVFKVAVEQDVRSAKEVVTDPGATFQYHADRNTLAVIREDGNGRTVIKFVLSDTEIVVLKDSRPWFSIHPSLNGDGHCAPMIGSDEYEVWQICRRALENLFFAAATDPSVPSP